MWQITYKGGRVEVRIQSYTKLLSSLKTVTIVLKVRKNCGGDSGAESSLGKGVAGRLVWKRQKTRVRKIFGGSPSISW